MAKRQAKQGAVSRWKPRHVLLADDGSQGAVRARAVALLLAAAAGARLTVTYVREPTENATEARRKLEPIVTAATATGVACVGVVERPVGITNPGRRIVASARRRRADLIVLGARGYGLAHALLGSVSSYVVSHAPMSVSVVR